jgi:hypothetical protein
MKIDRLETHDRLLHLKKDQSQNIFQGAEDCLKKNPLSLAIQEKCPYVYIFAHPRTDDDGVTKRMLWQPRISRPEPQSNSYLFRATSKTDIIEVCWLIPAKEMWSQYKQGNITESDLVTWSLNQYRFNRKSLSQPHKDDLKEELGSAIFRRILQEHEQNIKLQKAWVKV